MTQQSVDPPVKPALFVELEKYANSLGNDKDDTDRDLIPEYIQTFFLAFFQQFLKSEAGLEITGIDDEAKAMAIRRRIALEKQQASLSVRRLILLFQDLCDIWPDIESGAYVPSESLFRQVHTTYVPRLLTRIKEWAVTIPSTELAERAASALAAFEAASARL